MKILKQTVVAHAAYYQKPITEHALELMVEDLRDLPFEQLMAAFKTYRANPKHRTSPLPADLRAIIYPTANQLEDDHDTARMVASRIIEAISKHGAYSPKGAQAMVGEVGWHVVCRYGGWPSLCHEINADNLPMYYAQLRDLSLSVIRKHRMGQLDALPHLSPLTDEPRRVEALLSGALTPI